MRVSATAVKKYKEEFGFEFSNFGKTEMKQKDLKKRPRASLACCVKRNIACSVALGHLPPPPRVTRRGREVVQARLGGSWWQPRNCYEKFGNAFAHSDCYRIS